MKYMDLWFAGLLVSTRRFPGRREVYTVHTSLLKYQYGKQQKPSLFLYFLDQILWPSFTRGWDMYWTLPRCLFGRLSRFNKTWATPCSGQCWRWSQCKTEEKISCWQEHYSGYKELDRGWGEQCFRELRRSTVKLIKPFKTLSKWSERNFRPTS